MSSRSPGVRVLLPCSSTSASSRMGLAVSGRKAKPAVMPGRFSGSAMCGISMVLFWLELDGCFLRQIFLTYANVAFAGDAFSAFAVHGFVFGLPGGESVDVAVEHAE